MSNGRARALCEKSKIRRARNISAAVVARAISVDAMDAKIVALLKTAEDISKRLDHLINAVSVLTEKIKQFATDVAALDRRLSLLENRRQLAAVDGRQQPSPYVVNSLGADATAVNHMPESMSDV